MLAALNPEPVDPEASDEHQDHHFRSRVVGGEILAEAALSLIAIRKALE